MDADYTAEEINDVLCEMGYSADADSLAHLRDEILNFDTLLDFDDLIDPLFSEFPNLEASYIDGKFEKENLPKAFNSLLNDAHRKADMIYDEIAEIEESIARELDSDSMYSSMSEEIVLPKRSTRAKLHSAKTTHRSDPFKATGTLPDFQFDADNQPVLLDPDVEKKLIAEVCRQKGVKKVAFPDPGKAPFKHDPVLRNRQYQEAWKKFPAPGEKRRQKLRWQIRELMLRRDVPQLRLIPRVDFAPRPEWVE